MSLQLTATTRRTAGKVTVLARVTNATDSTASVEVVSDYGTRTVTVAAGRSTSVTFSTREASIPGGEVRATAGGETVTATYDAHD